MSIDTTHIDVDPYKYMNVQRDCIDKNVLKAAYTKMALQIHPDKNSSSKGNVEFIRLNACYRYLRTLFEQKKKYAENVRNEQKLKSNELLDLSNKLQKSIAKTTGGKAKKESKIDFSKPLKDTSVIHEDNFDPEESYKVAVSSRPHSTKYVDILQDIKIPQKLDKNYTKEAFEKVFIQNESRSMSKELSTYKNLQAFNETSGCTLGSAPIVDDGNIMFVVNSPKGKDMLSTERGYFMLENGTYEDDISKQIRSGTVSDNELNNYKTVYKTVQPVQRSALTFRDIMETMDYQVYEAQRSSRIDNKKVIQKYTSSLSKEAQSRLNHNLSISY